jgi:tetratricopeptide (TPR) repeat protein
VYGSSPAISELQRSLEAALAAGQWEEAIRLLARLRLLQPEDATLTARLYTAHITWGEELIAQGQYQKAVVQFNLALGAKPDGPEALDGLQRANALLAASPAPAPAATVEQPAAPPAPGPTPEPTANPNLVRPPNWPTDWPWPPKTQ